MSDYDKDELYEGSSSDKEMLIRHDSLIIFADGTYTCDHWQDKYYALWKIIEGMFHHRHAFYAS